MDLLTDDGKERGNACMKEEKYFEAMLHYTRGIKIDDQSPHLYSNRSLAFLRMGQHYHALEDAKTAIRMMPKWAKGYFRKGEIECSAEHYAEAVDSYKQGLALLPNDTSLQAALTKANALWMSQRRAENRMPWYGVGLGAIVGILLIVIDEAVAAKKPIFGTDVIRTIVLVSIIGVCYLFGLLYRFLLRSQRKDLLQCPPDLFGDELLPAPSSKTTTTNSASPSSTGDNTWPTRKTVNQRKKGRH